MSNEELAQQIQAGRKELMPELWDAVKGFVAQQAYKAACLEDSINEKTLSKQPNFSNIGGIYGKSGFWLFWCKPQSDGKCLDCVLPLKTPTKIAYIKERTQPRNREKP